MSNQHPTMTRRSLLSTAAIGIPAIGVMGALNLAGASPASAAVSADAFTSTAETKRGCRYVWGAAGPNTFDCSGLIYWSLAQHGISIPRTSRAQIGASQQISVSQALGIRGAVLYYPGHIAISRGDGTTMEARSASQGVGIFSASGMGWTVGGLLPGVSYSGGSAPQPGDPGQLAVDGWWGSGTTSALQKLLGTPADGVVSSQAASWKASNPGLTSGWEWVSDSSASGSTLIRAIQQRVGASVDGLIGPNTIKAIQGHFGTTQDGVFSGPSSCVAAMQKRINAGQF